VGGQRHALAALPPGKRAGALCIRGWLGHRRGVGVGKIQSDTKKRELLKNPTKIEEIKKNIDRN